MDGFLRLASSRYKIYFRWKAMAMLQSHTNGCEQKAIYGKGSCQESQKKGMVFGPIQ